MNNEMKPDLVMFILITVLVFYTVFVNAKHNQDMYPRAQNGILKRDFSDAGINLKNLKQLANAFPDHAVEIQAEVMQEEAPQMLNKHMKWLRENRNFQKTSPRPIVRSGEKTIDEQPDTSSTTTTTMTTTTAKETISSTTTATTNSDLLSSLPNVSGKRPLYMEDFIQALEDYQKKNPTITNQDNTFTSNSIVSGKRPLYMEDLIQALGDFQIKNPTIMNQDDTFTSNSIGTSTTTTEDPNRPLAIKDLWELVKIINCKEKSGTNNSETMPQVSPETTTIRQNFVKNFNDVLKLINKGVKVQLEVTTPAETDLNWIPIKILKEK